MSTLDDLRNRIAGRPRNRLGYIMVITSVGEAALVKNMTLPKSQWLILNHLKESGPSTIRDIAQETGIDEKVAVAVCKTLNGTYIRKSSGGEE